MAQELRSFSAEVLLIQASLVMVTLPLIHNVSMALSDVSLW